MILVFVETEAGGASEPSLEAVTFARDLATRDSGELAGQPIHAVVVGELPAAAVEQLGTHGVSEVHHAIGDAFSAYGGAVWAGAVEAAQRSTGAIAVIATGSPRGNEVLAHLAARRPHRVKLTLPPAQPSTVEVLGEGPETAPALVDLLQSLGVTR